MFQAGLIQDRNNFTQRLRWAAVDKAGFEEYINQIRLFTQELWNLLDPFRHDEMVSGLQMVLSHVIGMSRQVHELTALKETLQNPSIVPSLSSSSVNESSTLASVADIRAIGMSIGAAPGPSPSTSPGALSPLPTQEHSYSSLTQGSSSGSMRAPMLSSICLWRKFKILLQLRETPRWASRGITGRLSLLNGSSYRSLLVVRSWQECKIWPSCSALLSTLASGL